MGIIKKINILKPEALSIVDSYGLMHEEGVIRYFDLMNDNLLDEIGIAYHSHNNFQLAYSNSIKLMNSKTKRKLYFDGSLYGMGKSAGNCNIELLAMYANNNFSKKYDLNEILDIIDVQILKIFDKFKWGYQLPFFISASNNCHPNYVNYLLNKNMLTIKEINQIVNTIQQEKRLIFDETHCEEQYQKYQNIKIDDLNTCTQLKEEFSTKPLLLIAPGKSILDENNTIKNFIQKNPLIISINHINKHFDSEYVFFSNAKRFEQFEVQIKKKQNLKTITTSNISDESKISKYIINRNELSNKNHITSGSSLCLFLEFLIKIGIKTVHLAGFDGFDENQNHYYYDNDFDFYKHFKNPTETTQLIASELKTLKKEINIEFLTKSQYMKYLE